MTPDGKVGKTVLAAAPSVQQIRQSVRHRSDAVEFINPPVRLIGIGIRSALPKGFLVLAAIAENEGPVRIFVFDALDRLMKGKTSIVIAHRLSTIRSADVIFVVKDGKLVESGKHDQLAASGGLYSELYEIQFGALQ